MVSKYLKILEFDKIVEKACLFAVCKQTKQNLTGEKPATNIQDMKLMLSKTDAMLTILIKNGTPRLSGIDGVENSLTRASKGGILSMSELLGIGHTLRNFSSLSSWYAQKEDIDDCPLDDLFFAVFPQPTIEKHIFECIISETEMSDRASDTLFDLRRKLRAVQNSINDKLDEIIKNQSTSKYLQDAVVTLRNGRYVVPVKAEHKSDIGGVMHDVSSSGATIFVEPAAVVQANAKILQLKNMEKEEIERILSSMSSSVAEIEPFISQSYKSMLEIDSVLAKAQLAIEMKAMLPTVNNNCAFNLIKARHPLISKNNVVPIDIELGNNYDTLIITGPNTGGKTVTLKTAGLLNTMATYGYLIPAHEQSSVCLFDEVLVDIGDEQSIEQSLSTFSGHIKNITEILDKITDKSLVLMDELGAGTDPGEGAALAVAIIEQMRKSGAKIMATTHYAELKIFALDTEGVQNAGCEFNVDTLRPTYKIILGIPGRSSAFLISEKLGLPAQIIQKANVHLSGDDKRLNSVLAQLEDLKTELKQGELEIERLNNIAVTELEKAQNQREQLILQGEAELAAARQKANKIVDDVQKNAYALMDELKVIEKNDKQAAAQRAIRAREIARKDTQKLFVSEDSALKNYDSFIPIEDVSVGNQVYIISLSMQGIIQNLPDKKGLIEVRAGALRTKVLQNDLAQVPKNNDNTQKPKPKRVHTATNSMSSSNTVRTASMEINLIGMTSYEALYEVDKFIDGAILSGQNALYLIHGKGEGILRKAIHAHLKNHRNVKSYRLGTFGEGEAGVTVLELK